MAHHLEEQEQIERLKLFWSRYGKWVLAGIGALVVGYVGHVGYSKYQINQSHAAADLYFMLETSVSQNNSSQIQPIIDKLTAEYGSTPYASRGALLVAKMAYEKQQLDYAKEKFNWVIEHSQEPALQTISQIRLATVLFDEKKYQEALTAIENPFDDAFIAQCAELRGDIYQSLNDKKKAAEAYREALSSTDKKSPNRFLLEIKLGTLGN